MQSAGGGAEAEAELRTTQSDRGATDVAVRCVSTFQRCGRGGLGQRRSGMRCGALTLGQCCCATRYSACVCMKLGKATKPASERQLRAPCCVAMRGGLRSELAKVRRCLATRGTIEEGCLLSLRWGNGLCPGTCPGARRPPAGRAAASRWVRPCLWGRRCVGNGCWQRRFGGVPRRAAAPWPNAAPAAEQSGAVGSRRRRRNVPPRLPALEGEDSEATRTSPLNPHRCGLRTCQYI